MHVSTAVNANKKRGTFKAHKEAAEAYVEKCKAAKQAKAALAVLNAATSEDEKSSKKASQKTREGMVLDDAPDPELCVEYQAVYKKAKIAAETAKNNRESAATEMFQFYANLLSTDIKCTWNKIVKEQMEADPFKDLQGVSRKGSRGLSRESFNDCMMFHLLTVFPTTRLCKKNTTFPTCSRSPSGLAYVNLYSA
jgi:hypothetical protein